MSSTLPRGIGSLRRFYYERVLGRVCRFPERPLSPRLGGECSGGHGAKVGFDPEPEEAREDETFMTRGGKGV